MNRDFLDLLAALLAADVQFLRNKRATRRTKDLSDLEALGESI